MGGPHKILFFCKIDAGRVNVADKTTMKVVHDAAGEIKSNFGVIVNKVSKGILRKLDEQVEFKEQFLEFLFDGIPKSSNIVFLPNLNDLEDEDDKLISIEKLPGLSDLVEEVPTINLTPNLVKHIQVEEFDEIMQKLEESKSQNEKLSIANDKLKTEKEAAESNKGND